MKLPFNLPNKVYDILKWIVVIVLPAVGTLYTLLAGTWGLPYADQITTTILGVDTFLGTILMISNVQYNKQK